MQLITRKPLRRFLNRLFSQLEEVIVSATVSPTEGYTTTVFRLTVDISPKAGDIYHVEINWGDGTIQDMEKYDYEFPVELTKKYDKGGVYSILVVAENLVTGVVGFTSTSVTVKSTPIEVPTPTQCPLWMRKLYELATRRNMERLQIFLLRLAGRKGCYLA